MGGESNYGSISFDLTPMFGSKSSRQRGRLLSQKAGKAQHPDRIIYLAAKHSRDIGRYGAVTSYSIHPPDAKAEARPVNGGDDAWDIFVHPVPTAYELEKILESTVAEHEERYSISRAKCLKMIGVDEFNFFGASIEEFFEKYMRQGWRIFVAGLNLTAKGLPFMGPDGLTSTPVLASKLDTRNPESAVCWELDEDGLPCGREATHTLLMNEEGNIQNFDSEVVQVGGYNKYFPADFFHAKWRTPGELEHYTLWRAARLLYLQGLGEGTRDVPIDSIAQFDESRFWKVQTYFEARAGEIASEIKRNPSDELKNLWLLSMEGLSAAHYFEEFYLPTLVHKGAMFNTQRMLDVLDSQGAIVRIGDYVRPH
jgi:thymidine kinase